MTIPKRRRIIDRKALGAGLADLAAGSASDGKVLELLKDVLAGGRAEVRRRFESESATGADVVAANSFLMDQLLRSLHDFAATHVYPVANPTPGEQLSIVATGGYGRGEMAPYSDIDLLFLVPYKRTPHTEQIVEYMLYLLWDLGLKVGHATRSINDCIRQAEADLTIRTSLLEARWLTGDKELFNQFQHRFSADVVSRGGTNFVEAKLAERDDRHQRMGSTRYLLEPNVKEGKGGLRDLQTLFWIANYLYRVDDVAGLVDEGVLTAGDADVFTKAQDFLWTVRCHLHYLAGRAEERLTFDVQATIAKRMGYGDAAGARGVERFMKDYYLVAKDVGDLTRVLCAVLEDRHKKSRGRFRLPSFSFRKRNINGFVQDGGRLTVEDPGDFGAHPARLIGLFREAQRHGLDIHPEALRLVTQNLDLIDDALRADAEANRLFMDILTAGEDPETALKRLNEAGVFGRFIPEFGRVVAQMQYDMYHVYTVDEHTIRAIGILHGIETGALAEDHPVSCSVIGEVQSLRVLYLALLLHDIAKGRGGDHSEIGAGIALDVASRLGLNEWESEVVSWLVRHHLLMSNTAFKRDVDDPMTVADFVRVVQSPERLRLLLILTVADIRAVGPGVWNGWKAGLLRELYWRSQEALAGGLPEDRRPARVEKVKESLRPRLAGWSKEQVETHFALGNDSYWLTFEADTLLHHAGLIRKAEEEGLKLHIETTVERSRDVTRLVVYAPDHPGLFAQIAGAMALSGASVVDARIVTLNDGMALDTFWIQDSRGGAFSGKGRLDKLRRRIGDALSGRLLPARELDAVRRRAIPSRTRVFQVPPGVIIDNKASASHTVIEVNGRDRPGFLHDVTARLTGFGLQIASAHVSTYGERVVDVFYVKDVFGSKIESDDKLKDIHDGLLQAIGGDREAAPGKDAAAE